MVPPLEIKKVAMAINVVAIKLAAFQDVPKHINNGNSLICIVRRSNTNMYLRSGIIGSSQI